MSRCYNLLPSGIAILMLDFADDDCQKLECWIRKGNWVCRLREPPKHSTYLQHTHSRSVLIYLPRGCLGHDVNIHITPNHAST
jgi:hypothetical protein